MIKLRNIYWNGLEMVENGWKWLEMVGNGWKWLEYAIVFDVLALGPMTGFDDDDDESNGMAYKPVLTVSQ